MTRPFTCTLALVPGLVLAAAGALHAQDLSHLPALADVAPNAVAISPHVPHMGVHWADPATLPLGPIWCEIEGRVVCVEYMFTAQDLANGLDWTNITTGMQTPPITHINLEYRPDGAGPLQMPLYQLHLYFVPAEVLAHH